MEFNVYEHYGNFLSGSEIANDFLEKCITQIQSDFSESLYIVNLSDIVFIDYVFASEALVKLIKYIQSYNKVNNSAKMIVLSNVSTLTKNTLHYIFVENDVFSVVYNDEDVDIIGSFGTSLKEMVMRIIRNKDTSILDLCSQTGIEESICENRLNRLINLGLVLNNKNKYEFALTK